MYTPDGRLIYAGRAGTGMADRELERVWQKLQPLAVEKMPLDEPPPRDSRFGTPLVLSRVHWVRPEMVVEVADCVAVATVDCAAHVMSEVPTITGSSVHVQI